jgi:hypothetical protein
MVKKARAVRLSQSERVNLLGVLDALARRSAGRTARAVDAEIRAVRTARRRGGRRSA